MEDHLKYVKRAVALLITGSAILLFSCVEHKQVEPINEDTLISRIIDSMKSVKTRNGKKTNLFIAAKVESYEFARVPFTEYRQGIEVIAYNDSTGVETSHIMSDYALHWTDRDLWELKGNVVVVGEEGRTLYSQQLTWDRKTEKIYSNVDSKIKEEDAYYIVEGFEADDDFSRYSVRRLKGKVSLDVEPTQPQEAASANDSLPAAPDSLQNSEIRETPKAAQPDTGRKTAPKTTPKATSKTTPRTVPST